MLRQLIGPKVLVKKLPDVDIRPSGLVLPASARERSQLAKVYAVGQRWNRKTGTMTPLDVKVGEYVIYDHFIDYRTVLLAGEEYMILDESDCYASLWDVEL